MAILTMAPLPRAWAAWSCRSMPYSLHLGGAILQAYTYYAVLAMLFLLTTYLPTTTYCHSAVARPTHYLATYHQLLPSRRSDHTPPIGQGRWARPHPRRSIPPPSRVKVRVTLGIPPPSRRDLSHPAPDLTRRMCVPSGFLQSMRVRVSHTAKSRDADIGLSQKVQTSKVSMIFLEKENGHMIV